MELHSPARPFRRRLFGYRRADVDRVFDERRREIAELRAQVERLEKAEKTAVVDPFEAIGADVAGMLRALASSVADTRERAEREAADIVEAALMEADRIIAEAEAFAETVIDETLHDVEPRLSVANDARGRLVRALGEVQDAVDAALAAVDAAGEIHLDLTVVEAASNGSANGNGAVPVASSL